MSQLFKTVLVVFCALLAVGQAEMLHKLREGQEVCRALSLSGGGTKGAYEVGVLHKMARMLNGTDAEYDVLSGISIGVS